jgi:hypothetical protein
VTPRHLARERLERVKLILLMRHPEAARQLYGQAGR